MAKESTISSLFVSATPLDIPADQHLGAALFTTLSRSRHRLWRQGHMPVSAMAQHAMQSTQAILEPSWDATLFPADLPELEYPLVPGLFLGHQMSFHSSMTLTHAGRKTLNRILVVLTHWNPDLEYCPLLVHMIILMLMFSDPAQTFAISQAMVKRSRNRPLGSLWGYLPLSSQGQDMAVDALKNLAKLKLHASELSPLLSGEIFSYFPIHTQLQIAACYFAEGYKIMFRLAMLCLRKCNVTSDAHVSLSSLREFCASASLHSSLKSMFRYHLRRNEIGIQLDESKAGRHGQATKQRRQIVNWPNITQIRHASVLISVQLWLQIWAYILPERLTHASPQSIFCTSRDGYSFSTLANAVSLSPGPCIVAVKDARSNVFGVFLSQGLRIGTAADFEAVPFTTVGEFRTWRIASKNERNSIVCRLDDTLSISLGSEYVFSISEDMSKGIATSVQNNRALTETSSSNTFGIMHMEIIRVV